MTDQKLKVGQKVRVEDVQEGIVTRVEGRYICVDGAKRNVDHSPTIAMTRTITVLSEPKPDEPTGLGAVVKDAGGVVWCLADPALVGSWRSLVPSGREAWRHWDHIDAVEVLFPGVEL